MKLQNIIIYILIASNLIFLMVLVYEGYKIRKMENLLLEIKFRQDSGGSENYLIQSKKLLDSIKRKEQQASEYLTRIIDSHSISERAASKAISNRWSAKSAREECEEHERNAAKCLEKIKQKCCQ